MLPEGGVGLLTGGGEPGGDNFETFGMCILRYISWSLSDQ